MGYLDMEEKTVEAFGGPEGKYYHSGDLARRDERGLLYVEGRIKGIKLISRQSSN
jgi:acyl-CoA synthetase (AMP-forming)/AMP-acid ligase II